MSELLKRILFAIPAGTAFVAIAWLGGYYLASLLITLVLIGQYEIIQLAQMADMEVNRTFVYLLGIWVFSVFVYGSLIWVGLILLGSLLATEIFLVNNKKLNRLAHTVFWGIYGPLGFGTFLWVRGQGMDMEGFALVLSFLLMIWFNDIFAYFGGKYFGKHAMAPNISPNKTWEGFHFGVAGAVLGLFATQWIMGELYPLSNVVAIPMALLCGVAGPIGDLTQSRVKRVAGVKDSSHIFPGHGGVWDRFDSLILTTIMLGAYLELLRKLSLISM